MRINHNHTMILVMKKRIIIGRGNDCDIVIPDNKDNVSRHHMVITIDFLGKMKISDTSSNGTFINGIRMLKGATLPVKRSDNIRLGAEWNFDWDTLSDPFATMRKVAMFAAIVIVMAAVAFGVWRFVEDSKPKVEEFVIPLPENVKVDDTWNADSTRKWQPTEMSISSPGVVKSSKNNTSNRKKSNKSGITNKVKQKERQKPAVANDSAMADPDVLIVN